MAEPLRCTAKSKSTGNQCRLRPIPGGSVCVQHGGSIPAVKAAAQRKMIALIDPALSVLYRALTESDSWVVMVRAAIAVLDRAGMGVASTLTIDSDKSDLSELSVAELQARARVVAQQFAESDDVDDDDPPVH